MAWVSVVKLLRSISSIAASQAPALVDVDEFDRDAIDAKSLPLQGFGVSTAKVKGSGRRWHLIGVHTVCDHSVAGDAVDRTFHSPDGAHGRSEHTVQSVSDGVWITGAACGNLQRTPRSPSYWRCPGRFGFEMRYRWPAVARSQRSRGGWNLRWCKGTRLTGLYAAYKWNRLDYNTSESFRQLRKRMGLSVR